MGQGFGLGLNPSSLKWNQIDTDKVQVIYPEGMGDKAQRAANIIHMLHDSSFYPLGEKKRKVSIVVQNQTTVSNGFVTVGPFRSEFFTTPPQFGFGGSVEWWDFLTIHEYRHVEQFTNAKRGVTKIGSWIFGENGWGGLSVVAMPRWFFEGDATFLETTLTEAGRGRTPDFDKEYRALLLSGRNYNYEKASAFSIRDFVPSHYNLGYYMTTHIRRKYGDEALTLAAQDAASYDKIFYPFSRSLKKHTGLNVKELYKETFETLQSEWETEQVSLELTQSKQINTNDKKAFTSYQLPVFIDNNSLLVEKSGFQEIRNFIIIDRDGNEQKLFEPGRYSTLNSSLSIQKSKIVWAERTNHERWGNQNYNIIKSYDITSGTKKRLTKRTKLFAPDLSPDASKIIAVEVPENTKYSLQLFNSEDGTLLKKFNNPENYFYSFPRWIDNENIVVVLQKDSKNALAIINVTTESVETISPFDRYQLSYPRASGNYIYFNSTRTGIDNIHVIDMTNGSEYQVSSTLLGAVQSDISDDGSALAFSEFSAMGWDLKTMSLTPENWIPIKPSYSTAIDFFEPTLKYESILDRVPENNFQTRKFNKSSGLFNLHSWSPSLIHPNYGAYIFMNNVLTTLSASASYEFNVNEETSSYAANLTYAEFYPVIRAGFARTDRNRTSRFYDEAITATDTSAFSTFRSVDWAENDASVAVVLPFNLTSGNHFGDLELSATYHYLDVDYDEAIEGGDETFGALDLELEFSRFQSIAAQQVLPKWGQTFNIIASNTLNTDVNQSSYLQVDGRLFFPGLHKTHSFSVIGAWKQEDLNDIYKFRDNFRYARGYGSVSSDNIWTIGIAYSLPLWLPDIPIGPFLFIKRLKTSPYIDISRSTINSVNLQDLRPLSDVSFRGTFPEFSQDYRSVGFDLRVDFRFLRLLDMDVGVRYSYLLDDVGLNRHRIVPIIASIGF